jgi:hypothetical protein
MGHVYGLDHSRRDGSTDDYQDQWDTMSTWNSTFRAAHPRWTEVGPGLNAMNMRGQGWLDERRVWRSTGLTFDRVVDLRPLHRRELPGFLCAELPGSDSKPLLLVEFRDIDRWDAGIPDPTVLVHRFDGNRSYIMHDAAGNESFTKGKVLQYGDPNNLSRAFGRIEVLDIDVQNRTARIRLQHRPASGIIADPSPEEKAAAKRVISEAAHRDALKTVMGWARGELEKASVFKSPAPKLGISKSKKY